MSDRIIQAYHTNRSIDRSAEVMPKSWRWPEVNCSVFSNAEMRNARIKKELDGTHSVICLLTKCLDDTNIISYLHNLAQNGHRVYLLLGSFSQNLQQLTGNCLIRILPEEMTPHGSLIIRDPGSNIAKSFLLSNSLSTQNHVELLCTSEDQELLAELFRYYCYLFWEQAEMEYLSEGDSRGGRVADKGVDVFYSGKPYPNYLYDKFLINSEGVSRGLLLGKYVSLEGGTQHLQIKGFIDKDLDSIPFSDLPEKDELERAEPKEFPDELDYIMVDYHWAVLPFYLPKGAKQSSCYKDWEEYKTKTSLMIDSFVDKIKAKLNSPQADKGTDYNRLHLIFREKLQSILKNLEPLANFEWGTSPETREMQKSLEDIKSTYEEACQTLDLEIKRLNLEQRLSEISKEKRNLETTLQDILDKYKDGVPEEQLNVKEIKKSVEALGNEEKRIKREQSEITNGVKKESSSSLDRLYNPSMHQIKEKQMAMHNYPILPSVGELFEAEGKSFLAIRYWDEYEEGLKEALRLGAKLCAFNNI